MAWVLATVLGIITTVLKDTLPITDLVQSSLMILPIMIVVQAITLPFLLKFGGDKGRIAMIGAFGGLAVITLVIVKGAEAIFNIDLVSREFDTLKCKKVPQSLEIGLFFCQIFIFII